jgi:RNA-directed DNA polymerase
VPRKHGTNTWHVYTFIADRPIRQLRAKIRALTRRTSQQNLRDVLIRARPDHARLGQLLQTRGLQAHLQQARCLHLVASSPLADATAPLEVEGRPPPFTSPTGAWKPITADGIEMFNVAAVPVTRYRYRGNTIPNPWNLPHHT